MKPRRIADLVCKLLRIAHVFGADYRVGREAAAAC